MEPLSLLGRWEGTQCSSKQPPVRSATGRLKPHAKKPLRLFKSYSSPANRSVSATKHRLAHARLDRKVCEEPDRPTPEAASPIPRRFPRHRELPSGRPVPEARGTLPRSVASRNWHTFGSRTERG